MEFQRPCFPCLSLSWCTNVPGYIIWRLKLTNRTHTLNVISNLQHLRLTFHNLKRYVFKDIHMDMHLSSDSYPKKMLTPKSSKRGFRSVRSVA